MSWFPDNLSMTSFASVPKLPESRKRFCGCCCMPTTKRAFIAGAGWSTCVHVAKACSAICSGRQSSAGAVAAPCAFSRRCSATDGCCTWTTGFPRISASPVTMPGRSAGRRRRRHPVHRRTTASRISGSGIMRLP